MDERQEIQYKYIPHRVIAEEYIENIAGDLYDYKFYCFNGVPEYIQLIIGRHGESKAAFFDLDWNIVEFNSVHFGEMHRAPAKPKQLDKAIEIARILSEGFPFVRVDLYLIGDDTIYFGEMTFTPSDGMIDWVPKSADRMLGEKIILPVEDKKYCG